MHAMDGALCVFKVSIMIVGLLPFALLRTWQALDDLSATKARLEEAQSELAAKDKQLDSLRQDISANTELIHEVGGVCVCVCRGWCAHGALHGAGF